ncbi:MAG: DUF4358 domain-containing protein [Ruminococcus sp.]|nr:DUF4358 domain-containing protein [Ruminococcus sp.]
MLKKLMLCLIISCMTVSLVACGQSNSNNDIQDTSNTDSTAQTTVEETSESETSQDETSSSDDTTSNSDVVDLHAMVDEVTSKVEWASLSEVDDKDIIQEYFTLQADNPNYKQILVMQCPMSAVIAEIILIQAEDTQSAMQDLQARKDKLINTDAFYPEHKEIAEQSIVGSYGDIVYFIADYDAQESEKVLLEYLKTLE